MRANHSTEQLSISAFEVVFVIGFPRGLELVQEENLVVGWTEDNVRAGSGEAANLKFPVNFVHDLRDSNAGGQLKRAALSLHRRIERIDAHLEVDPGLIDTFKNIHDPLLLILMV